MTSYDDLPYVEAELNYLAPMAERPRYYAYDPEPEVPRSNLAHEALLLKCCDTMTDGRAHRPHDPGRRGATRKHRAAYARFPPRVTVSTVSLSTFR